MEPPGLIKLEKEIEQEETLSTPLPSPSPSPSKSPGKKSTGKLLDDAVRQTLRDDILTIHQYQWLSHVVMVLYCTGLALIVLAQDPQIKKTDDCIC